MNGRFLVPLALLLLLLPLGLALADDPVPAPPEDAPLPVAPLPPDGEKPLAPKEDGKPASELPGDRKIYVPFGNLKDVFEKEGQGVFVPYEEFMRLWEANLDRRPVPEKPPVPYLVTRALYEGEVQGDLAVVKATIEFETFTEGWSAVPLGFAGVAMGEATLGNAPATLESTEKGFRVLVPERGAYVLTLSFVVPVVKKEDRRTVAFGVPATPVSRLVFDVPEEDARVTVEPNLATTRTGDGKTHVMAYVGAAEKISLSWQPKPAVVETGPALVFADVTLTASVEDASLRTRAQADYRIYRAAVTALRLALPGDDRVLFVEGEEIRRWEVTDGVLLVELYRPVENAYRLTVTLERNRPEDGTVSVPAVKLLDVAREQGTVLLRAPATVRAVPATTGLYRTGFETLDAACRTPDLVAAWRYPAHPYTLDVAVSRIRPLVEVDGRSLVSMDERRVATSDTFTFHVSRAPVFEVRIGLPAGLAVTDVSRDHVEDFRIEEADGARVLVLSLKGSRIGDFAITVAGTAPLALADAPLPFDVPILLPLAADRLAGLIGVARDDALKVDVGETRGLVAVNAADFGDGVALAFRYATADRAAKLTISRREAEVTARVDTTLKAEENRIAVRARIIFLVKHAGVDSFSFLLPSSLKDKFQVSANNLREKPVEDAGDGRLRQKVVLQGKVTGEAVVTVEFDLPYEGLAVGDSKTIEVPMIEPEKVTRDEGTYAVYREPMLEIREEAKSLEPIDPRELPAGIERKDVFVALKYLVRPHALSLVVTKHEFLPVLTAVVHHMQIVTVVNEEGTARTEVVLKMTNNGLQFLSLRPEAPPDTLEIVTRGADGKLLRRKEVPQAGADGAMLVRMPPEAGPEDVFFVKLVYPLRAGLKGTMFHDLSWSAPKIQDGAVPVLGTTWYVYPPVGKRITQAGGTLTWFDKPDSWLAGISGSLGILLPSRGGDVGAGPRNIGRVASEEVADLAPRNQPFLLFGGRVQDPAVSITFASPGAFDFLLAAVFLLVLGAGVALFRCGCARSRGLYVLGCVAVPLLLAPVAAPGTASVLSAVVLGGLVAGAYFLAASACGPVCGWWAARKAKTAGKEE